MEEDTSRIYTGAFGLQDFLTQSSSLQLSHKLEKSIQRLITMELHEVTLVEYFKLQFIPRGLRVRLVPTLFVQDTDFYMKFAQIINKCSFDIMILTVQFLQKERLSPAKQILEIETQLDAALGQDELIKTKKTCMKKLESFMKNVETRKRAKVERDQEDYTHDRVYNWNNLNY